MNCAIENRPAALGCRRGFVMPVVVMVMVVLSVTMAGAFSYITSEGRVVTNVDGTEQAFRIAQRGLDAFLADRSAFGFVALPPAVLEQVNIPIENGVAQVVLERTRPAVGTDPAMYVVRSTGVVAGPRPSDPPSRRTVAQMAQFRAGSMNVRAGWLSLTGLHKNGSSGTLSGVDNCGAKPNVAGVSVPTPPGFTVSGSFTPTGTPPTENLGTVDQAVDQVGVDWDGLRDKTAITPDIVIPGQAWPSFADVNYWPIIHVTGNYSLPGSGRGILIVTGTLTINGNKTWSGIVMSGGAVISDGNNNVFGATLSSLDAMLQPDPAAWAAAEGQAAFGNGNKTYQYDSCNVTKALESFGSLAAIDNAWMDNWATF